MKLEKLVGSRFKERPSECVIDSHVLMLRGGFMKYVAMKRSSLIISAMTYIRRI
jgi:prolyl-tRNA synthetase